MELVRTKRNINLILKDFKEMEANEDHMSLPLLYLWKPIFQRSIFAGILVFTAQCKIFQITTPELVQVKIYLKLVQVNLPELLYILCVHTFPVSGISMFPLVWSCQIPLISCIFYSDQIPLISCIFFSAQIPLIPCIFCSAQIPLISCIFFYRFRSFRSNSAHSGHLLHFFERNLSGLLDLG